MLEIARQRLDDTKVRVPSVFSTLPKRPIGKSGAPADGAGEVEYVISGRSVSEGEMLKVSPTTSMTVFNLVISDPLELHATVPERFLGEVKVGQDVAVDVEAYPDQKFAGTISRVNPTVDRANRTFMIEVAVPNHDRKLSPGSFAKASISTRVDLNALTVPEESLVNFAGVTKVYIVRDGKAHEAQIETGERLTLGKGGDARNWFEVKGDLAPGTPVVTAGQTQLSEGRSVRARSVEAVAGQPPAKGL